ncbi:MAG TPA: VIT1/CCC1 transporter family protein [Acidimicrobiales bacterium]|nr:VIT1/CCC1 transporter family protein [Acidimicrobiales bacterium]
MTTAEATAATRAAPGPARRVVASLKESAGSIVFGMEDGTVSIFGLVFGVSASAPDSHAVLLAGATGAAAAAVSMMAGTYLDVQSSNDQARVALADERGRLEHDRGDDDATVAARLMSEGFTKDDADRVLAIVGAHEGARAKLGVEVRFGAVPQAQDDAVVQSAWMFLADLIAASVPVIPFAIFSLTTARTVSLVMTFTLIVLLGVGRAMLGRRRVLPTVVQTLAIAAGAGLAGVLIGRAVGS